MKKTEIWKDIEGYGGIYQISSDGKVISFMKGRDLFLKPSLVCGRLLVKLYKKKYSGNFKNVGHLVAEAFIRKPKKDEVLIYLDGNPLNNNFENLKWITKKESVRSARNRHRYSHQGQNNGMAKLTLQNVKSIKEDISSGKSIKEISEKYNVIPRTIERIRDKKTWSHA
ncbi:NUMOD4 domain-containing protein [Chryseobacterium mucoviscidosis]|uniref:NUMOD4 domain-containing protein n=1 Tax=Chryseobacterium mucoviscidosis TaxID=1945581 RepID=UPI003016CC4B